jgi:hypothetical protein
MPTDRRPRSILTDEPPPGLARQDWWQSLRVTGQQSAPERNDVAVRYAEIVFLGHGGRINVLTASWADTEAKMAACGRAGGDR